MEENRIRVWLYGRTQGSEANIASQMMSMKDFAKAHGLLVAGETHEYGSDVDTERECLIKIREILENGTFDMLLVTSMDRISTNLTQAHDFLCTLEKKDGILYSLAEGKLTINNDSIC